MRLPANDIRIVAVILAISSFAVLWAGLTSERCLGDELYHWRFATSFYLLGTRPAFDPVYGTGQPPGYFFNSEPLWHVGLALLWKATGGISAVAAQFYQAGYYALLIASAAMLARALYGPAAAMYAALLAASVPALAAFGIVLYIDVAAAALSSVCLLFVVRRKLFLAGLTVALMYFTKRNACFFVPAFLLITLYLNRRPVKRLALALAAFLLPVALTVPLDMAWRERNLVLKLFPTSTGEAIAGATVGTVAGLKTRLISADWNFRTVEYLNSSLLRPFDVLKYFGVPLLIGLMFYAVSRRRERRDAVLLVPILTYLLAFCYFFSPSSDIRYLIPVMPLLAAAGAKPLAAFRAKRVVFAAAALCCAVQLAAVCLVVNRQRQIPDEVKAAFSYFKRNASEKAIAVYPEYTVLEAAERRFVWVGNMPAVMRTLFWSTDSDEVRSCLKENGIEFVIIKKSRVYDDRTTRHYGGYPQSFVQRLPTLACMEGVFDNAAISIWRVK